MSRLPDGGSKAPRCGTRSLSLFAPAYCIADPSISGFVEREGAKAIRESEGPVELFVQEKETPRYILFQRRVFTSGSLALRREGLKDKASEAAPAGAGQVRS